MSTSKIKLVDLPCDYSKIASPEFAIGVGDSLKPVDVLRESVKSGIQQIVQKNNADMDRKVESAKVMTQNPDTFLEYPVSSILRPEQAGRELEKQLTIFNFKFDRAGQKSEMLKQLSACLAPIVNTSASYDLCLIADELFSNACYNAPYSIGQAQSNNVPRDDLKIRETVLRPGMLSVGKDGNQVAIVCRDHYGSLDLNGLLRRLLNCFERGASNSLQMDSGGAGLGSMLVYNVCAGYYVGIERNARTIVAAAVALGKAKHHAEKHKTLHLFSK